jgi:hypothetical protein
MIGPDEIAAIAGRLRRGIISQGGWARFLKRKLRWKIGSLIDYFEPTISCPYCGKRTYEYGNFCTRCAKKLRQYCFCPYLGREHNCGSEECLGAEVKDGVRYGLKNLFLPK